MNPGIEKPAMASRFLGGILVFLALAGIAFSLRGPQKASPVKSVLPVPYAARPPAGSQTSSGWPGVSYLEVRAYYSSEPFIHTFAQAGIPDQVDDKDGVLLSKEQERRLIAAVTARVGPYDVADCLEPRHAFVFYDPLGEIVKEVDICFQCFFVVGSPSDSPDLGALAELVGDLGLPIGPEIKDAEQYRKYFERLAK